MHEPLISIVVPTYNRAGLITKTIESILAQQYKNFEVIIVDDGSTDNTEEVVLSIVDSRVSYYKKLNEERAKARNFGIDKSKGDYVTFLDSDDIIYPDHIEVALAEINKKTPVFWSPYEEIDADGNLIKKHGRSAKKAIDILIEEGNFMSCHGVFIRRDLLDGLRFNEDRSLSGSEDMELWLRIASQHEIVQLDKVTNALIHHDQRSVFNFDRIESLIDRKELMIKYISQDPHFMNSYAHRMKRIRSRAYTYIALHSAMNPNNPARYAYKYLMKAFMSDPISIFERRTLATLKHSILRLAPRT